MVVGEWGAMTARLGVGVSADARRSAADAALVEGVRVEWR
jgi:hypothetical protein